MNIKRNINFALEGRRKGGLAVTENVPIRMRVAFGGSRIDFSTGYRIDAAKWDPDKQKVKNGCTNKLKQNSSEINTSLLKYYTDVQNIFKEFEVTGKVPTPAQVKKSFTDIIYKKTPRRKTVHSKQSFDIAFNEFVRECGKQNNWTESTYEKFAAVKNHLAAFNPDFSFDFFDETGLNNYVSFLRDIKLTIG